MTQRAWIVTALLAACVREQAEAPGAAPAAPDTVTVATTTVRDSTPAAASAPVEPRRPKAERDTAYRRWLAENDPPLPPPPKIEGYPIIYRNSCVGEVCGVERIVRACADIPLHESAAKDSPLSLVLKKGDTAVAGQDLHVIAPGIVVIKRGFPLDHVISEEGNPVALQDTIRFAAGDTLFLELYGQEGVWHTTFRGKKLFLTEFWGAPPRWNRLGGVGTDSSKAVLRSEHYMDEWWSLQLPDGRTGWKLRDDDKDFPLMVHRYTHAAWTRQCGNR